MKKSEGHFYENAPIAKSKTPTDHSTYCAEAADNHPKRKGSGA